MHLLRRWLRALEPSCLQPQPPWRMPLSEAAIDWAGRDHASAHVGGMCVQVCLHVPARRACLVRACSWRACRGGTGPHHHLPRTPHLVDHALALDKRHSLKRL